MLFLTALSLAPAVNDWLANTRHPRILHIFDRACNLINERREVLSIVTPQIGNGPFNLVLEDDICFSDHLNIESQVSISPTQLIFDDLTIYTADAKLWTPRPNWQRTHDQREDILKQLILLRLEWASVQGKHSNNAEIASSHTPWHRTPGQVCQGQFLLAMTEITNCQLPIASLSHALANADISYAKTITSQLAGLGIGLTPSGDDFILGAIYAAWIIHPFEVANVLAQEIAQTAVPLTTSLSAAWLRSAGRGEAGILWHQFFDALISNVRTQIEKSTENILAVGETSGADALAGFIRVFVSWMETTGSKYG